MTYEAAMIVMHRPDFFNTQQRFRAAGFIIEEPCAPKHIKTDHDANRRRAQAIRKEAFDAMVDGRF